MERTKSNENAELKKSWTSNIIRETKKIENKNETKKFEQNDRALNSSLSCVMNDNLVTFEMSAVSRNCPVRIR